MAKKRIMWLDFAKGITVFLVVIVHVVEGIYKTQMYHQYNTFSEITMGLLFTIVMPIFFALSGYVYKPVQNGQEFFKKASNKLFRLGMPYIIFSIIYVVLQHVSPGVHSLNSWHDLLQIYVMPVGYLWYLYVLFLVYVFVEIMHLIHIPSHWQMILYAGLLLYSVLPFSNFLYPVKSLFMWVGSFYIGYILKEKSQILGNKYMMSACSVLFLCSVFWQGNQGGDWFNTDMMSLGNIISKITSIPIFLYLFSRVKNGVITRYFIKYGRYSLIIYLVHAPVASIVRTLILKIGLPPYTLLVMSTLVISWGISIFVIYLSGKFSWVNFVFYPDNYFKRMK
ncbi:acyltransferase [Leuconostoc gelidum subsp. aenigmaticum]|uniref:acyltransferase family protein n=1 Tax=Leuconostoc gelidum TaxID=1244 RepID=UPI001CC333AD|nr:acyltransferase [Leuconostoc gelidum subsp. aenigmaticum]